ncbi:sugar ABC transporter ATP-binding protein [Clostridiales bacterium BAD-6]|uniref:Ribose/galactose/methyl galactoside import ATP-binding protein n=2 Tax=Sinanaerobacter chloroacetimidivorans TaxID=2818044 RepID=A0A8J8B3Q2_9FIRM|nr:sugar ABC transporter ATP-binding protein [Sinanaerobacter chloroacetimidivorans]
MNDISKSFSGVKVLDKVSLKIKPGEVHALMGENGAGKSTLMKILMGIYKSDSGSILLNGEAINITSPKDAISKGISMIHQELNPVLDMEVSENIFVGRELLKTGFEKLKIVDKSAMREETAKLFQSMNISINPKSITRRLSVAEMQLVEIVKAISLKSNIIIMDEPTSAITEKEVDVLFTQIEQLKNKGVAIIYISHKMDEIFKIADSITVLRDGVLAGTGDSKDFTRDKLISLMVGREIKEVYPKENAEIKETLLEIQDLCRGKRVNHVSFQLHSGEVLGIAGLVGSGRSELVETIFGIQPAVSGRILVKGKEVRIKHPKEAIAHKMAMITEDRKRTGLNLKSTVEQNISLVSIRKLAKYGIIDKKKEGTAAEQYIESLKIKTHSKKTPVISLSGGNQQKVVLAKWLLDEPEIIIFDEPTRGIDVGAKRDIYTLIGKLAKQGKGILVISSEMPEVMGISDRILVMSEGTIAGELKRDEFTQEAIMNFASARGGKII